MSIDRTSERLAFVLPASAVLAPLFKIRSQRRLWSARLWRAATGPAIVPAFAMRPRCDLPTAGCNRASNPGRLRALAHVYQPFSSSNADSSLGSEPRVLITLLNVIRRDSTILLV